MYGGDGGYCSPPFRPPYSHDNANTFTGALNDGLSSYSPGPLSYSHQHDDFSDMRANSARGGDNSWSGMGQRSYPPSGTQPGPQSSSTSSFTSSSSNSMGQSMPPTTANVPPYGMYNRINARMSPMKTDIGKSYTPQKMPVSALSKCASRNFKGPLQQF